MVDPLSEDPHLLLQKRGVARGSAELTHERLGEDTAILRFWQRLAKRDCEGLVAKDEKSLYEGGPRLRWVKVKQKGWTDAEDRWQRRISADA